VAILFSGGMDSLSLLISCIDLGIKPKLYTFYLDNHISEDIRKSREIAKIFNLKLTEIKIETSKTTLIKDVKYIIKNFKTSRKTAIQCIQPFLYIAPKIEEKYVLSGLCADDLYGTSRSVAKLQNDIEKFNELRLKRITDEKSSSYLYIKNIINEKDKIFIAPYKECKEIYSYMLGLNYKDMNSPKQKQIMYNDYKEILEKYELYRRNSNLQCDSKIREWHDELLKTEENINNNKSVVAIYNRFFKEIFSEVICNE
jgi:asparagine synthetase B (glutamine-hydrolysing)